MKIKPVDARTHQVNHTDARQYQIASPVLYLLILKQNKYTVYVLHITCDVYEKEKNG
jgi:hypothetical protein